MGMMTMKIKDTIELLKNTDIDGCISGSCMLPDVDFDLWSSQPDVDVFVYSKMQMAYAVDLLQMVHGFKELNDGEVWKLDRMRRRDDSNVKAALDTVKLEKDGVIVNVTWKKGRKSLADVLASFDMTVIMRGYDIRHGVTMDLRKENDAVQGKFPPTVKEAWPNPLRDQDADMYTTQMWVRQFDRVIKYWNRGFDTRPMAEFYVRLIDEVIAKGALFTSDKATEAWAEFLNTYQPIRQKMAEWLESKKEEC